MKLLTEADFERAAKKLRCDVPSIKAVAEVESRGKGFYADGFPVILFERHKFRKYTQGRYNKSHPHLSGEQGGYGKAGQNQRNKFNEAFALSPAAAMMSCSWGKFQIMGFNHDVCGFNSVGAFVDAMKESEGRQLDAFVGFVIGNNLAKYLRTQNWAEFAEGYNGSGYKQNRYDTKMATAYRKYSATTSSKDTGATLNPTGSANTADQSASVQQETLPKKSLWERITDRLTGYQQKFDTVQSYGTSLSPISGSSKFTVLTTKVGGWLLLALGFLGDHWMWIVVGLALIVAAIWYLSKSKDRQTQRNVPAQTQEQTVVVK